MAVQMRPPFLTMCFICLPYSHNNEHRELVQKYYYTTKKINCKFDAALGHEAQFAQGPNPCYNFGATDHNHHGGEHSLYSSALFVSLGSQHATETAG